MTTTNQSSQLTKVDTLVKPIIGGIAGSSGIILLGVLSYVIKFHDYVWLDKPEVWGQLGDYLNMYVSAGSLILVSVLTYVIHQAESRRAEDQANADVTRETEKREEEDARNRPVLVFIALRDSKRGPIWKIKNITHNVALNVLVSFRKENNKWDAPVILYSPGHGEERELYWFNNPDLIRAVYYDVKGNVITSTIQHDRVEVETGVNGLGEFSPEQYIRVQDVTFRGDR